jgi:hypothetical protein
VDAGYGSPWAERQADGQLRGGIGVHTIDGIPVIARRWSIS